MSGGRQGRPDTERSSTARDVAMGILKRCEQKGQYSNIALDQALARSGLSGADRALTARLVYGVTERKLTLDHIISSLCDRTDIEPDVRMAIRLGLYQLLYLDRIPDHAAVDQSVRLVPRRASGFVNALLRQFLRNGKAFPLPDAAADPVGFLSVAYSIPAPLVSFFLDIYPFERVKSLFAAINEPPPLTLRVNTEKITRDGFIRLLADAGIHAAPCRYAATGVVLPAGAEGELTSLPGFAEGYFFVQDEASQICTAALGARPGETVADVCACPGSKSFGAAIDMQNEGRIFSSDLHENKLSLIRSGAERLGISCISTAPCDARHPDVNLTARCDRVLADVPCSGFGVIAKKPEIRFKDPSVSVGLPDIQLDIALASADLVKPGGVLVYSTCTLCPEENERNVARFLAIREDFTPEGFCVGSLAVPDGQITLAPDTHGTDGFFVAKLRRRK